MLKRASYVNQLSAGALDRLGLNSGPVSWAFDRHEDQPVVPSRGSLRLKLNDGVSPVPQSGPKRQAEHRASLGKAIERIASAS